MADSACKKEPHVFVLPLPVQSHINPMLDFSKRLAAYDVKVTFFLTPKAAKSAAALLPVPLVQFAHISDGSEDVQAGTDDNDASDFDRLKDCVRKNLDQEKGSPDFPKLIVYDSVLPWILEIAHQENVAGASFFTQSCSVAAIFYHLSAGFLGFPYNRDLGSALPSLPALPALGVDDLPSFPSEDFKDQSVLRLLIDQFSNLEKADWVLFNSFNGLENEVVEWMSSRWAIRTIGPTNILQEKMNEPKLGAQKSHPISLFEPADDESCIKWLDSKQTNSVIYVSFGSLISLKAEQLTELAQALLVSQHHFLWVVRASERHKLPENLTSAAALCDEKGLIVNWCKKTEVLNHSSVAVFLTHGGWNSTIEALSYGVPLVVMPHWVDQTTNSKLIEDVWRVGVRVRPDESGIVSRQEIARCVEEVMIVGNNGEELRGSVGKWRKMAREAVDEGVLLLRTYNILPQN